MENKKKNILKTTIIIISGFFILYGFMRNETEIILNKAVNICLECIGLGWWKVKIKHSLKRKLFQIIAFGYSNPYLMNFKEGKIFQGKWKQFCNPGLNCYSCPAASFACPIGALQAVNGSMNFNFSFYVVGILLAFGVY